MILDTETVCKYTQYQIVLYITDLILLPLQNLIFYFSECDLVI
jgi:hypothetical protein